MSHTTAKHTPGLSDAAPLMLELLKDIATHLERGASLHPGSLIFREDAPAIEVIRAAIDKAER